MQEPLLDPSMDRFVMFPIEYQEVWDQYKDAVSLFWTAEEVDLTEDVAHWKNLNEGEQHFLKNVLAFFAASDGIVNENLCENLCNDIQIPEARAYYTMQMLIETIHSETYSLLIDTYITEEDEKNRLFKSAETMPIIKKKASWALNWINADCSFAQRLLAFCAVEGVFFSSSFCSIYWIKERGLLPGLCYSNELIARDEGMHTDFAILLYKTLQKENQLSEDHIHKLFSEACEIECEFATDSLPVSLIGMNSDQMQEYIKYCVDRLLTQIGVSKLYNAKCPFDFMERISLQNKTNFHEKKVAEYRKASVGSSEEDRLLTFDGNDF